MLEKSNGSSGDRSERIRTYNYPQGRVTDHRINLTLHKLNEFLSGDIFEEISDQATITISRRIIKDGRMTNIKIALELGAKKLKKSSSTQG